MSIVSDLSEDMMDANEGWEARETTYTQTHAAFAKVAAGVAELLAAVKTEVAQENDSPALDSLFAPLEELLAAATDVIRGLEAPDSEEARREAMTSWLVAVGAIRPFVLDTTPTTVATTVASGPTDPRVTATSVVAAPAEETSPPADNSGAWLVVVLVVAGLAYRLGRRRKTIT